MNDRGNNKQQQTLPVVLYQPNYQEDEINLLDIWRILVRQRNILFTVTAFIGITALAGALFWPTTYKAELFLLPPSDKQIEQLNIPNVSSIEREKVYAELVKNLKSRSLQRQFFENNKLREKLALQRSWDDSPENIFEEEFHEKLIADQEEKLGIKSDFVTFSFTGRDPELAAEVLNNYLKLVDSFTVRDLVQGIQTKLDMQKNAVITKIEGMRKTAKSRRLDRIAELQEALVIANKLGISHRTDITAVSSKTSKQDLGVEINTSQMPLYLRGSKELQAEIDVMQQRKSDDPFIAPLRGLQEELAQLNEIVIEPEKIKAVRIDQPAFPPEKPDSPKRILIVGLGLILGMMTGLFVAFGKNFLESQSRKEV